MNLVWGRYEYGVNRVDSQLYGYFPYIIYQRYLWIRWPLTQWCKTEAEARALCEQLNRARIRR
ncbi:hypothetical protein GC167_09965 [bacterium]|nr:hypothetical protein [bacterium]